MTERHPNAVPESKGNTVIKFVLKDDPEQTLDVVKESLTKHGLMVLRKRGYVQASKLLQEQAKAAADKEEELGQELPEEEEEDESPEEEETQEEPEPTPEPPKTPGRPRRS